MGLLRSVAKKVIVAAALVVGKRIATRAAGKINNRFSRMPPLQK